MKKVLIATGEFGESLEVYYAYFRLKEAGIEPIVAAPRKKRIQLVVHDFEPGYDAYTEKLGYGVEADVAFKDVSLDDLDGLILPGGRAPEEIRLEGELLHIIRHFMAREKPIAAICHGVMLLHTAGSVEDVELTCYPGIRPDVELAGAIYRNAEVVVHENIVTSRGWPDLPGFLAAFLRLLEE